MPAAGPCQSQNERIWNPDPCCTNSSTLRRTPARDSTTGRTAVHALTWNRPKRSIERSAHAQILSATQPSASLVSSGYIFEYTWVGPILVSIAEGNLAKTYQNKRC